MNTSAPRLHYFANVRLPSERANSIQIVNMCAAFAAAGLEVNLFHPRRINRFATDAPSIHAHYGVPTTFKTEKLLSLDFIDILPRFLQPPAFRIQSFTFGLRAVFAMRKAGGAVFYIRDSATLALASTLLPPASRRRVFYEAHDFPGKSRSVRALARAALSCGGVVAITKGLSKRFREAGIVPDRLHVAPDGVDLSRFQDLPESVMARSRLYLPEGAPLAVYTGQFFPWKGVETLIESLVHLPDEWRVVLVGGRPKDRRRLERAACAMEVDHRLLFRDPVPPSEVPLYLRAADVLVLPNSGRFTISTHYTSPMKLFEYMAAGRPIAASDLPSLREVLTHEENALLFSPADDPRALAGTLVRLLTDQRLQDRLVTNARRDAARFGWRERALEVRNFIGRLVSDWEAT